MFDCPVDEQTRIWIENTMIWLIKQFSLSKIKSVKTFIPTQEDFPFQFNGTIDSATNVLRIVAPQMDLSADEIEIEIYDQGLLEIPGEMGHTLFGQQSADSDFSTGMFLGKEGDKYLIGVEKNTLRKPIDLIATMAHELSHIKILGEEKLSENDEYLTDLVTIFFGFGVFGANASFQYYSTFESWSYSKQGYLSQQEWGYGLAIYAYIRKDIDAEWMKFLRPNIQSDFLKSMAFINKNTSKVLR